MEIELLQRWLHLPVGPWPPEDRELLGLPSGSVDAALAEQNALERMELLRPHQLKHPELVTEGMNRLAQALLAVLSPLDAVPPTPPSSHKAQPSEPAPPVTLPAPATPQHNARWEEVNLAPEVPGPSPIPPESEIAKPLEAEVILSEPQKAVAPAMVPTLAPLNLDPVKVKPPEAPVGTAYVPEDRRKGYRELVLLRRLLRRWEKFAPIIGIPSEPLHSAESVYRLLQATLALRHFLESLKNPNKRFRDSGHMVLSVVLHPSAVVVLRELLPDQRRNLANDWASAKARLQAEYDSLRRAMRKSVPRNKLNQLGREFRTVFSANPEWILVLLGLLLLLFGVVRWLVRQE